MNDLRLKYSARFKRDYVAYMAIVIFFLIVISEVTLAVSLPLYMYKSSGMADYIRKQQLLQSFDIARNEIKGLNSKDASVQAEVRLISWTFDSMADYLRDHAKELSPEDVITLQKQLNEMRAAMTQLRRNKPFSKEYKLDCGPYIQRIIKKAGENK